MDREPEELRQDIERTRRNLSRDADALNEKVNPRRIVHRRLERAQSTVTSWKDRVMGSADTGTGAVSGMASTATDSVESVVSTVGGTVGAAPAQARSRAVGNPLAAGMIAFATGWLLASLAPASDAEKDLARAVQDKASDVAEPVKEEAGQAMSEIKDGLRQPVQEAAAHVRGTATDAAGTVSDEDRSAKQQVAEETSRDA